VRALLVFLLLAATAVLLALLFRVNVGYALFVAPPYRVEISLNALLLIALLAFAGLYILVRMFARVLGLPAQVRESRRESRRERARARQDAAVVALIEGRDGKARQFAEEALAIPESSPVAALIGARAALEMRDYDDVVRLLAQPEAQLASLAVPRLMLEAELAIERGQPTEALARLGELRKEAGLHTAALRLEMRALMLAGRHAEIPPLIEQLAKRKVYDAAQAAALRATAHADTLRELANDAGALRAYFNRLSAADRTQPRVARSAARSFLVLGGDREAADALARSLEREWQAESVLLYAECNPADPTRQLETAESWLAEHSQDASLLYALGRLCERQQLWGKAESYLEASLAIDAHWRTHLALGELLARLQRPDEANAHLAAALRLALEELRRDAANG